ncbi:MAG TPA: Uma2 family endonuclease [Chloroflexota bacterium]|jgi:Uma2 family endonuclease
MAIKALFRAEDLEGIQSLTGRKYELVRGELYEMVTTLRHGAVTGQIYRLVANWNDGAKAGIVTTDGGFHLERNPDTVRGPDVSFVRKGRLTKEQTRRGFPDIAPDVAFEVRSPNDTWADLVRKAEEYLAAGVQMVVLIEADEFVEVRRPGAEPKRLGLDDVLDGQDVMPGFSCRVRGLFPEEYA